ncbi:transcription factor FER-LIKE IRON DEFICIENCY-INDUCED TRANSCRIPTION FACTOR-like isoform X2 [Cicer arietinum]|uniref:Transcription factor FER-LIKE IRON DEFICIENCY-INDUCED TRANSCRIPTION FACTOR-like isoform X2 n=1 Tax=Cicer arietinum TaxID=3827 RepID=A0A1S3EB20_CICAR|nr:transcription factor FER-LIKE IRON DEFICIENCY-INDUCED TRANSCRIPTION FACTOR-like isoform X2 [Cicer arietinum]
MDEMNVHQDSLEYTNNFELHDFVDDPNFDQFIDLIRGENEDAICNFGSNLINDCFIDNHHLISSPINPLFDHNININNNNNNNIVNVYDPRCTTISSLSCFDGEIKGEGEESSGTTNNVDGKSRAKSDRSKTLISERRRRGRMKDKLYALRSLVPNITKMDKASIIGDAVSYVHDLQAQARKLKAEVSGLEALSVTNNYQGSINNTINVQFTHNNYPISMKILQIDMFQVEERGYYAKILCNKGEGVAASLYKALESLANFNIQNSNLATLNDNFLLTFTLNSLMC